MITLCQRDDKPPCICGAEANEPCPILGLLAELSGPPIGGSAGATCDTDGEVCEFCQ